MTNPEMEEVFKLSDYFHQLGNALGGYIQDNKARLRDDERNNLVDKQIELLRLSGRINTMGIALVFDEVQDSLQQMNVITEAVKKTVKKALLVQDAIHMATALVSIGTAIISRDSKLFLKSCVKAGSVISSIKNKKI